MAFPRGTESGDSDARDAAAQIRRRRYSPPPPSTLIDDMGFQRERRRQVSGGSRTCPLVNERRPDLTDTETMSYLTTVRAVVSMPLLKVKKSRNACIIASD